MSADLQPIEILIVDDEPSVRLLLKRWIERSMTARVREASDGLQALEQVSQGGVEMIVSDINMPVLNGIDMLSLLQADPGRKKLEVLIASQVSAEEKVKQAIELGVSDYLLKPLQYEWVIGRLKRAAERIYERRQTMGHSSDNSRTRVLVADADPNYCAFAESTLETDFAVQTARTVAETLVKTLRFRPDLLLFDAGMPGLNAEFLIDRLARLPGGDPPAVYELREGGGEPSAEGVKGVVSRSFVPETMRSELLSVLRGGEAPERGLLAWASSLQGEIKTAAYQALGMLTGVEPEKVEQPPESGPGGAYGWIEITADNGEFKMRLDIESGRDLPRGLLAAMLGEEPGEDDGSEPPLDALQEILNVVAGRIKNSCLERQIDVSIGLPEVGFEPPEEREAQFECADWYRWSGGEPFRLRLDANPSNEEATGGLSSGEDSADPPEGPEDASPEEEESAAEAEVQPEEPAGDFDGESDE